jgi:hypothetical protein
VPSLFKIRAVVLEKSFKRPQPIFTFSWLSPLWRGPVPLFKQNLNSLYPKIICTKFDWFWPAGSGEEDFGKNSVYFYTFTIISPWRRVIPLVWTSRRFITQGWFVPSVVKLGPVVLEKKIFKWSYPIFTFLWLSRLWIKPGSLIE